MMIIIQMSLFKLKHLWIQSFPQQEFDQKHLSIGKIDNQQALALGTFSGKLSIYRISTKPQFKINSIYNNKFDVPIVAVEFVDYPEERQRNCIGVLLQRKFVYLLLKANSSGGYDSRQVSINVQPSFAIQPQSLSTMTINSSIQYLNPLSKQQIKVSDPIYPFHRKTDHLYYSDGQQLVHIQNTTQQWRITVGPIRSIHSYKQYIIIIGDNALWEVEESKILKTKVMEEEISCGVVVDGMDGGYNVVVADFKNRVFVYTGGYELVWAVKCMEVPVGMRVFGAGAFRGAIAMIGEQGTVSISYLGSQLPQTQIQSINQDIDMNQVQSQISKLSAQLKQSQQLTQSTQPQISQPSTSTSLSLSLRCSSPQLYTTPLDNPQQYFNSNGQPWSCQLICELVASRQPVYDVVVCVETPSNISCVEKEKKVAVVKGREKVKIVMLCSSQKFPYSQQVQVIVRYKQADKSHSSSVVVQKCQLPFNFQCTLKSLQLQQKPTNKIVFKAHSDLPPFSQIFHEFGQSLQNTKNLTIRLPNGILCSMGYNKNNTKVKIQSNLFSGLCFIFVTFYHRFQKLIKDKKVAKNEISIDDIPLQQFFTLMKDHYNHRTKQTQKSQQLQQKSEQFRNAQKKLLLKMKQKVSSINNIDKLLEYTYHNLIKSADQFQQVQEQLQSINHNLQIALNFILELLFMKTKATGKCREKVYGIIGYEKESMEYGWEEKIMANSSFYLNKKFNYNVEKYTFDQLYKTALWVISKINSGDWNQ